MSAERQQILEMVRTGQISSEEAMELLNALASGPPLAASASAEDEALTGEVVHPGGGAPDSDRFRRFWQIPFFIALGFLIITGLGLRALYQSSEGAIGFWFICVWGLFILAFLLTALAFVSRRSAWLHVRVQSRSGRRVAISLPLPLGVASWGLQVARGFVDEDTNANLELAAAVLEAARHDLHAADAAPLIINVDEEDGDRVQVYLG